MRIGTDAIAEALPIATIVEMLGQEHIAMVTAPSIETSAISASRKMLAQPFQRGRQGFKQVVEHLYGRWRWQLQIFGNGGLGLAFMTLQ